MTGVIGPGLELKVLLVIIGLVVIAKENRLSRLQQASDAVFDDDDMQRV
jgi:hypothetical protein